VAKRSPELLDPVQVEKLVDNDFAEYAKTVRQRIRRQTPLRAIREKCVECCGNCRDEVKFCVVADCPLWRLRFGRLPNTAAQRHPGWLDPELVRIEGYRQACREMLSVSSATRQSSFYRQVMDMDPTPLNASLSQKCRRQAISADERQNEPEHADETLPAETAL
jgi:hypothetical protein